MGAEGEEVVGMEAQPPTRLHEGAGDPAGFEPNHAAARAQCVLYLGSTHHMTDVVRIRTRQARIAKTGDNTAPIRGLQAWRRPSADVLR